MSGFGIVLLVAAGAALILTGLPAWIVLLIASVCGAGIAVLGGADAGVFAALPSRLFGLLENDMLQAIPLYVLMGALLDRLPVTDAIFRTLCAIFPSAGRRGPLLAGLSLGALLGPMNGSVGASVVALTRAVGPRLKEAGVAPATRQALIAVAGTLGVVVPPSLVLILLGDAMLTAHTVALNATGRMDLIVNTRDVFRAALVPAGLFLAGAFLVTIFSRREAGPETAPVPAPSRGDVAIALVSVSFVVALLGGVAAGRFYAVEAAAMGAFVLAVAAAATGRLAKGALGRLLDETFATTGVLFALLMAATTFTLVLRVLGTNALLIDLLASVPGGALGAAAAGLAVIAASAFVLDAFEIIFVIVPIVAPAMLMRVEDAAWIAALILLTLQVSFLTPPVGYALMLSRSLMPDAPPLTKALRRLAPYLGMEIAVVLAVFAFPVLVHPEKLFEPRP
ncbi:MAG: TRAP transporter large permease subunit, partial [Phyllobacteriaceae bacterium]|nr:TRAP transporter large permease subunit [Phyllobacteriaceae bacterium]